MKNARCRVGVTFSLPPGLEATRSTFPSNELLGYCHASLRDVPRLEATRSTFPSNELLGYSHASLRDVPRLPLGDWLSLFTSLAVGGSFVSPSNSLGAVLLIDDGNVCDRVHFPPGSTRIDLISVRFIIEPSRYPNSRAVELFNPGSRQ